MSNLRIVYDNALSRYATLVASSTAGSLAVTNLLTDFKTEEWRSTGTTESLTLTWTNSETVSCVILPFTNLTPTATIRVRGYTNVADGTPAVDTGTVLACPATAISLRGWGAAATGSNAYAYGGGSYARVWLAATPVKKIIIDLVDTSNASGYIEVSRLVTGNYWQPAQNVDYGASVAYQDLSKPYRNDAGDLMTDIGTRFRKMSLNVSYLSPTDRKSLVDLFRGNGLANPFLISVFAGSTDYELERDHMIYCKLSEISAITIPQLDAYSSPLVVEEI